MTRSQLQRMLNFCPETNSTAYPREAAWQHHQACASKKVQPTCPQTNECQTCQEMSIILGWDFSVQLLFVKTSLTLWTLYLTRSDRLLFFFAESEYFYPIGNRKYITINPQLTSENAHEQYECHPHLRYVQSCT